MTRDNIDEDHIASTVEADAVVHVKIDEVVFIRAI